MHWTRRIVVLLAAAGLLAAQRHRLTINAETPEGAMLQQIGQENDAAKKLALMEDFAQKNPKHEGTPWVLDQMVAAYGKAGQHDKVIATGEKLLALDADDVTTAHNCLKASEGLKNPDLIKKWAGTTSKLARKAVAAPKPSDDDAVENWKAAVDYAKQVDTYTEYSIYAAALQQTDPAKKVDLYESLEAHNAQSQYLPQLIGPYFLALQQSGAKDKAVAVAEKVLEKDQSNEDMLLVVADNHFNKKTSPEKVIAYSAKLVEVMGAKPKPQGVSDEDWSKRKDLLMGLGHWMTGITYGGQNKFKECDLALRQALPLVKSNEALTAQALFWLGLANYKLAEPSKDKKRMAEALRYNAQCAAIKSPFAGQAAKNATAIRQQYGLK